MYEEDGFFNNNGKKYNKKNNKIEKIKKYYEKLNEDPEKVSSYVKRKVVDILSLSDKSRFEIEEKIYKNIKREQYASLVSDILDYFEELNYINDERFVENYIRIRFNSGYGKQRIEKELKEKNVDMFIFEEYIEKYNFDENLSEYIDRKYPNLKESTIKDLNKVIQKLVLRGFDYSKVKDALSFVTIMKEEEKENKTKFIDKQKFIDKLIKKGYGKNKIIQDGKIKGMHFTDKDFESYDFYELAEEYKIKKYGNKKETDLKVKAKQTNHMLGRGFSFDEIREAL